jgi:anaerobic magnesium-protoporphyrin IX monomethyl ester cyclase
MEILVRNYASFICIILNVEVYKNHLMKQIKIKFVSVEEGVTALGFRRVAAVARKLNCATEILFITPGNLYSFATHIFPTREIDLTDKDYRAIARELSSADLVCFSSMTPSAHHVERIAAALKRRSPHVFTLWGGTHCILHPEDAIKHVDAICTWEGEIPYQKFYRTFSQHKPYLKTPSMWFKTKKGIIKNKNLQLNNSHTLSQLPHLFWGLDCQIYDSNSKTFRQFTQNDYLKYNGLAYKTIWSIGCPYSCIYCANDAFIKLDLNYRLLRYSSIEHLLREIEVALKLYPFISSVYFIDDNFIAIPTITLKTFCREYKKRINLPFAVVGLHPNLITKKKIELLGQAGMNRGRMGIQSGSEGTLSFYNRPTPTSNIVKSATILAQAAKKYNMIPAAYDIISDNPIETKDDLLVTLKLLYKLTRPYTLTIFSLRVFPKTKLYDYFQTHPQFDVRQMTSSYLATQKNLYNILLYVLAVTKPPSKMFNWLLKYVKPCSEKQRSFPVLYLLIRMLYLSSRAVAHLKRLDFSTIVGPWGYFLWQLGLIKSRFRPQANLTADPRS